MTDHDRSSPPVEPLADVAWSRVERGVWDRLDADPSVGVTPPTKALPSRRWLLVVPLAAAAAIAVVVLRPATPTIHDAGPTRIVSEASPSHVSLADAQLTLDPHSAIVMESHADAPTVLVERGAAWFEVEPRGTRPPFVVIAGDTRVRVIGTRFRVARDAERTEVTVDHGIIEVGYHGETMRLTAGQTWSSASGPIASAPPSPDLVTPPAGGTTPDLAPRHPPPPVPATTDHEREASPKDAARFAELTRLEASEPDTAMKGYLTLSQGSGRWAEVALFAAARLASDRHDARAVTLLDIYLRRFPSGANVVDARQLLTRLQGDHR